MQARWTSGGKVQVYFKVGKAQLSASGDTLGEALMGLRTGVHGAPRETRLRLVEEGRAIGEAARAASSRRGGPAAPPKLVSRRKPVVKAPAKPAPKLASRRKPAKKPSRR